MTYKNIEASREARLWLTQIVLPVITVVALVPGARNVVVTTVKKAKNNIKTKFSKK